jgi:hypothetical protein
MLVGGCFSGQPMRRGVHGATGTDPGGEGRRFGNSVVRPCMRESVTVPQYLLAYSHSQTHPNRRIHRSAEVIVSETGEIAIGRFWRKKVRAILRWRAMAS